MELLSELKPKEILIENLFINPNNPRLMEKKRKSEVLDLRIIESGIQDSLIKEIQKEGISDLIEKITKLGFLTIDRIVVRELENLPGKYLVLEGNRRIATVKTLLKEHTDGIVTLEDDIYKSLLQIEVLVYSGTDKNIIWLLQGIRHINGIKEWGSLQQSRFLYEMQNTESLKASELDKMTGLGRNSISNRIRSYKAFQYCKTIYHGEIVENNFSLFQEVIFARPMIKDWLAWDDKSEMFNNDTNLELILNWYLGDENGNIRISRALDLRDQFNQLLLPDNKNILTKFINEPTYDINDAIQDVRNKDAVKSAQKNQLDLEERLNILDEVLSNLITLPIKKITEDQNLLGKYLEKLDDIKNTSEFQSNLLEKFKK